jgi:hypothetical protein
MLDVACVRRRGENIHLQNWYLNVMWQMWRDKEFLSFISENWNGSRYLAFWSLGTLIGLRDQVRGLIA